MILTDMETSLQPYVPSPLPGRVHSLGLYVVLVGRMQVSVLIAELT